MNYKNEMICELLKTPEGMSYNALLKKIAQLARNRGGHFCAEEWSGALDELLTTRRITTTNHGGFAMNTWPIKPNR